MNVLRWMVLCCALGLHAGLVSGADQQPLAFITNQSGDSVSVIALATGEWYRMHP